LPTGIAPTPPTRNVRHAAALENFQRLLDNDPRYGLYSARLVPTRGRARGRSSAGTAAAGSGDALLIAAGLAPGHRKPVGAVAAMSATQRRRGGPSRGVPMRHAAHPGNTVADAGRSAVLRGKGRIPGTAINGRRSPGVSRSKPRNTARGTPGNWRFVVTTMPVYPLPFFVHRATGRSAPRRSAHPRTVVRADGRIKRQADPAPAKQ